MDKAGCPCGRTTAAGRVLPLVACCGRYRGPDAIPAPDPESLMRSRYTAYTLEDVGYLLATWHPSTRPVNLVLEPGTKWLGLEVRAQRWLDDDHGEVSFVARSRWGGRGHRLQERSRFVRESGLWFYVDGDVQ